MNKEIMESAFYTELFNHFMAVAWREAPGVAGDDLLCREIFHDRVLFPGRMGSMDEVEAKVKGRGRRFATVKAYKNYLHTMFKNAIIDHLRESTRRRARLAPLPDEGDLAVSDPAPAVNDADTENEIRGILSLLSREERRLLTLRYREKKTLTEIGRALQVSKSTVERWEKAVEQRIFVFVEQKKDGLDEQDLLNVFAAVLANADNEEG
ncbi:MAG TPA: sigma-70 family RNA polymerase sigma factor [bacterium]|nr:sigma-70 family RNA polymerase sigma factor [bacterium]